MKSMIQKFIGISILAVISIHLCGANDGMKSNKNVKVTYIANEGFLIEVENKSVLIDALFGDKELCCSIIKDYKIFS